MPHVADRSERARYRHGRKAMAQMLDYIDNPAAHVHSTTLIEPTLIRRESTRA